MVLVFVSVFAFAQAQPRAVLSKTDIDNFVKHYAAISEAMSSLSSLNMDLEGKNETDIKTAIAKARSMNIPADLSAKLAKFGLGNNAFEKCIVVSFGIMAVFMEEMFAGFMGLAGTDQSADDGTAEFKKTIAAMKTSIHANDYNLISSRKEELIALMQN